MRIIPNLFLEHGKAVSLYKGTDNEEKKIYPKAPRSYVEWFEKQGAKTLFIVDLSGTERERLPELRAVFSGELWWAGHVRDIQSIQWLLDKGANRIVLGEHAEPIFTEALSLFGPEKLLAGIQAKHYDEVPNQAEKYAQMGFKDLVVKDMNAEGTLFHPNYDLMEKCAYFSKAKIYASGGVANTNDIHLLGHAGVKGVIIGRAFYENELNLTALQDYFEPV